MEFLEILKAHGIEVPKDKSEALTKDVAENYKTAAEYEKVSGELDKANKTIAVVGSCRKRLSD